jgi:hypothetical protein
MAKAAGDGMPRGPVWLESPMIWNTAPGPKEAEPPC